LEQLQTILKSLSNIYLNALYSVSRDKSSRPKTFFEDIAMKLQNLQPMITIKEGQQPPSSIQKNCDRHHLIQTIKAQTGYRNLHLYDCSGKNYTYLMSYKVSGNQWILGTSPQGLEAVLPNNLGYLSTITFKPRCQVILRADSDEAKISKADCRQWGQQISSANKKLRKTLLINSLLYDYQAENILTTEAQYIDYDGNNQLCRTGVVKRKAPNSKEFIYIEDDEDQECKADTPSAPLSGQALSGQVLTSEPMNDQSPPAINPRAQALPRPNTKGFARPQSPSGPAQFWPGRFGNGAPPRRPFANGQVLGPDQTPLAPSELDQDPRQGQMPRVLDDGGVSENNNDPSLGNTSEDEFPLENSNQGEESSYLGEEQ
jgi:hypothetical protein